jgi:NAD(P)-dependent dehydrogenase (short-subunit alcohol dehydrogenase family)
VLASNAASFYAGYFEELTPEEMERQLATTLIGPMNVTRAVLTVKRKQRSGHGSASGRLRDRKLRLA